MSRWPWLLFALLCLASCLKSYDLTGFPCKSDADCPGGTCQALRCAGYGASPEVAPDAGPTKPCQPTAPTTEVCDGKDNDCNGKIDDIPSLLCTGSGPGCDDGKTRCVQGKELCVFEGKFELCGDDKDNDCDGMTDEIDECGPAFAKAEISQPNSARTLVTAVRGFDEKVEQRNGANGKAYLLKPTTAKACDAHVLLLSVGNPHHRSTVSYTCDAGRYLLSVSNWSGSSDLFKIYAVQPGDGDRESWARVRVRESCAAGGAACRIDLQKGSLSVQRKDAGVYTLQSPRCDEKNRPMFATLFGPKADAHIQLHYAKAGHCHLRITGLKGEALDRDFAVWFPDPKGSLWITVDAQGEILAEHLAPGSPIQWKVEAKGGDDARHFRLGIPPLQKGSVALVNGLGDHWFSVNNQSQSNSPKTIVVRGFPPHQNDASVAAPFTLLLVP